MHIVGSIHEKREKNWGHPPSSSSIPAFAHPLPPKTCARNSKNTGNITEEGERERECALGMDPPPPPPFELNLGGPSWTTKSLGRGGDKGTCHVGARLRPSWERCSGLVRGERRHLVFDAVSSKWYHSFGGGGRGGEGRG